MSEATNKDVLNQAVARFNAKDLDGYLQMFHASVLHHGFSRHIGPGASGLKTFYRQMAQGFPDGGTEVRWPRARSSPIATLSTVRTAANIWASRRRKWSCPPAR